MFPKIFQRIFSPATRNEVQMPKTDRDLAKLEEGLHTWCARIGAKDARISLTQNGGLMVGFDRELDLPNDWLARSYIIPRISILLEPPGVESRSLINTGVRSRDSIIPVATYREGRTVRSNDELAARCENYIAGAILGAGQFFRLKSAQIPLSAALPKQGNAVQVDLAQVSQIFDRTLGAISQKRSATMQMTPNSELGQFLHECQRAYSLRIGGTLVWSAELHPGSGDRPLTTVRDAGDRSHTHLDAGVAGTLQLSLAIKGPSHKLSHQMHVEIDPDQRLVSVRTVDSCGARITRGFAQEGELIHFLQGLFGGYMAGTTHFALKITEPSIPTLG